MLLLKWDVLDDTEVPVITFILDNSQETYYKICVIDYYYYWQLHIFYLTKEIKNVVFMLHVSYLSTFPCSQ